MTSRKITRPGFTIIEMLAVVMIIGTLVGLLLPSVQSARERARQVSCSNNLMQVGLGTTAYHATFGQLPMHLSGTDGSATKGGDNDQRLSVFVGLLPFLGHEAIVNKIRGPLPITGEFLDSDDGMMEMSMGYGDMGYEEMGEAEEFTGEYFPVGGPEPFRRYPAWLIEIPEYRCPSDPGYGDPAMGRINYAACLGDGIVAMDTGPMKDVGGVFVVDDELKKQTEASMRGAFVPRSVTRLRDVTDGLSSTILFGEICTDLGDDDRRTAALIGPGEKTLRDNPNWAYESESLDPERPMFWALGTKTLASIIPGSVARGHRWADGAAVFTVINTILPPNQAITASSAREDASGIFPPSSRHPSGVGVCLADGSVRFVSNSIDGGDRSAPTVYIGSQSQPGSKSPYGVWGAMGTRASEELVFVGSD